MKYVTLGANITLTMKDDCYCTLLHAHHVSRTIRKR